MIASWYTAPVGGSLRSVFPAVLSVVLLGSAVSDASAACPAPYTTDNLLADLMAAETAVKGKDAAGAGTAAGKLESGLPCLDVALPRPIAGRAYRAIGGGFVVAGNGDKGEDWLRTAAELEPTFAYGVEDLPGDHPVRGVYDTAKASSGGEEVVGGPLVSPETWVDGRKQVTEAKARADRPHLVQVKGAAGVQGWIVDGAAFPPEVATKGSAGSRPGDVADAKPPKGEKPPKAAKPPKGEEPAGTEPVADAKPPKPPKPNATTVGSNGVAIVKRKRPWEKTPLLIGGTAIVLGGAGVYGLSFVSHGQFEQADTLADVEALRTRTNTYFVTSLAVIGVGVGTFTWGAILADQGPIAGLHVRF